LHFQTHQICSAMLAGIVEEVWASMHRFGSHFLNHQASLASFIPHMSELVGLFFQCV